MAAYFNFYREKRAHVAEGILSVQSQHTYHAVNSVEAAQGKEEKCSFLFND